MEKSGAHRCALPAKFKPGNGDFDRSPRWRRCLGGYSREDAKSCNAIPAKRLSAAANKAEAVSAECNPLVCNGNFHGTVFGHTASKHKQTHAFPNIPFEGIICVKKIVIQKSQNRPDATPNPE